MKMSSEELLRKVKNGLGITGDFQDGTLQIYIEEVKEYLKDSGVKEKVVNDACAVGVIVRGVIDLWNYGSDKGTLSSYFIQRAIQLTYKQENELTEDTESAEGVINGKVQAAETV